LFIVSELLRENLYDFGKFIRENGATPYFTMPRLKRITKQILEALKYIHSLKLIHCDLKPVSSFFLKISPIPFLIDAILSLLYSTN
jgi:serine/threonine protein kinase